MCRIFSLIVAIALITSCHSTPFKVQPLAITQPKPIKAANPETIAI